MFNKLYLCHDYFGSVIPLWLYSPPNKSHVVPCNVVSLFIGMEFISPFTKDLKSIVNALNGRWGRVATKNATYVVLGQIVFCEGDVKECPIEVISWHTDGSGSWGILK